MSSDAPKARPRRRRKRGAPGSRGLSPAETRSTAEDVSGLSERIREDGGTLLADYLEPLGAHRVLFASLPIDKVEPTPYQRDVSEAHVKRLVDALERVGRFLDPIIAVRRDGMYWTPNGNHRLQAAKFLGAKTITALVLPDEDVAFQILALNTEKAHNLKERSLEAIRMFRGLVGARKGRESDFAAIFEEPNLLTLGAAYEKRPRYSAGAYNPVVKRIEEFLELSLEKALAVREARADRLLELDDRVIAIVAKLKERGLDSPYLKNFVVARLNFLRFKRGATAPFDSTVDRMIALATKFDAGKVKREEITRMGGGGPPIEE